LYNYEYPAHKIKLGWNNGDGYHVVTSLPHGWTQSTVCIASVSPTDVSMTVLLDPVDGPYRTCSVPPISTGGVPRDTTGGRRETAPWTVSHSRALVRP